jgi:hypothetical protein
VENGGTNVLRTSHAVILRDMYEDMRQVRRRAGYHHSLVCVFLGRFSCFARLELEFRQSHAMRRYHFILL